MDLSNLKPALGSTHHERRIGRGQGSGKGGTSTRGHKGAKSRSGYHDKIGFEGGQMPLQRRVPKFGFKNVNRVEYKAINVNMLQFLAERDNLSVIDRETLINAGLLNKNALVKILGEGTLTLKLEVKANAFSKKAVEAIEAAGGSVVWKNMKLFDTLKNIWKIEELRTRILTTLGLILVYRLGTEIVLPGIDPAGLAALQEQTANNGVLGLLDMFSGGAFSNASIFALGIMPYISASIVVQLLGIAVPYFQRMQREGESGRRKINQITRYLTVIILILQGSAYLTNLHMQIQPEYFLMKGVFFTIYSVAILAAGSMFVLWLGEKITDKGIGNGVSIIIMIGIIARLPFSFFAELTSRVSQQGGGLVAFLLELVFLFFVFCGSILLVQGTRKVPVQYAKRIVGNKQYGGVRQYIPLKINAAGVMPIIFAQAIMLLPISFINYAAGGAMTGFAAAFSDFTGFWYNATFFVLIVAFTYFYTAITVNPMQMSEDMKKNGGFIPGVKPGRKTMEFLDTIMSRITLPGSIFLGIVAIMPAFATMAGVNQQFAQFYGGTSLLILVGVVLDTLQQIESHLLMRHYDGLMKTGLLISTVLVILRHDFHKERRRD